MSTTAVSRPASMRKAVGVLLFMLVLVGTGMLGSTKASAVVAPAFTGIVPADHWQGVQKAATRTVTDAGKTAVNGDAGPKSGTEMNK
jgi:hypothetical protein